MLTTDVTFLFFGKEKQYEYTIRQMPMHTQMEVFSGKGRLESCVLLCSDLLEPFSWRNNNNYTTGRFLTLFTDS